MKTWLKNLSSKQISKKDHREFVGGMWDQLGRLQLEFMIGAGLKPHHKLLDIGCGCLRGGIYYIQYLVHRFGVKMEKWITEIKKELVHATQKFDRFNSTRFLIDLCGEPRV